MSKPTLKSLIKEHEERLQTLRERVVGYRVNYYYPDMLAYYTWVHTVKRFLWEYFTGDESAEEFCKLSKKKYFSRATRRITWYIKCNCCCSKNN